MIRRWSSINEFNFNIINFSILRTKYKVNIFRSTVGFRRPIYLTLKFKRKTLSKWKRKSLWFSYVSVFKYWILDYQFTKKNIKIQYIENILPFSFYIYNFNLIKNFSIDNPPMFNNLITIFNSRKSYNFMYNIKRETSKYLSFFKNSNHTLCYSYNEKFEKDNPFLIPIARKNENLFFTINDDFKKINFLVDDHFSFVFETSLLQLNEIYKITILLNFYLINLKTPSYLNKIKTLNKYVFKIF